MLLDPPERFSSHLTKLVCDWPDTGVSIAALSVAGPVIAQIRGYAPDIDLAVLLLEDGLSNDPDQRLGHDIGVGFTRFTFDADTVDQAVTFFVDTIGDPRLTQDQKNTVFLSALGTILTIYSTAF